MQLQWTVSLYISCPSLFWDTHLQLTAKLGVNHVNRALSFFLEVWGWIMQLAQGSNRDTSILVTVGLKQATFRSHHAALPVELHPAPYIWTRGNIFNHLTIINIMDVLRSAVTWMTGKMNIYKHTVICSLLQFQKCPPTWSSFCVLVRISLNNIFKAGTMEQCFPA